MLPERYSLRELLNIAETSARLSVRTQYACQVVGVSEDGRFVDLIHNSLEWAACPDGDTTLINEFGQDVLCAPTKPWTLTDVPVEEPYLRGQWNIKTRPRIGDKGILSVFYHDIGALKEKGGFQAPATLRVMPIESASWRPGLPNHADVNAESEPYASDDEFEITGNDVSIKLTAPNNSDSSVNRKLDVKVGGVTLEIKVPQSGNPTVTFNAPNAAVNVTADTANINLSGNATVTAPTTTLNSNVSVNGTLNVSGATTLGATLEVTGMVQGEDFTTTTGAVLGTHTHMVSATGAFAAGAPAGPTSDPLGKVPTPSA